MQLTDSQKDKVRQWANEGASLSQIQDRLAQEFDVRMSFIDVRLLVLELRVSIKEKEKPTSDALKKATSPNDSASASSEVLDEDEPDSTAPFPEEETPTPAASKLQVSLSRIAQPGFAICGEVTFSDGVKAQWGITARGELSLAATSPDYRPSASDIKEFQIQLRNLLSA